MDGREERQDRDGCQGRISDLCIGYAGLAELASGEATRVADLFAAGTMNVAELVQHRALLGKDQKDRKCKTPTNPIHVSHWCRVWSERGYHSRQAWKKSKPAFCDTP